MLEMLRGILYFEKTSSSSSSEAATATTTTTTIITNNNKTFWYKAKPHRQSQKVTYCIESVHRETHGAPCFKGCTRDMIKVTAELCRLAVLGQRSLLSLSVTTGAGLGGDVVPDPGTAQSLRS